MSYIGNSPSDGENNSFKLLDSISSYTQTFDGSSTSVVSLGDETLTFTGHRFITGQRVTYTHGGGTAIGGLTSGTAYYIIKSDQNTIKLALTQSDAINNIAINLTALGTGTAHTLNVAFDGINTQFKATYDNGTKAQMTRAAQLQISINGVIQQPQDTTSPTNGFGIDLDSVIIFSSAPIASDVFWGNLFANNFPTFDIADNTVDSFTGNGVLSNFTLSKTPANNQNVLVTLDGVVQYPSDATTSRAYSVAGNVLTFTGVPGNGVSIQVRHIGFAGATSSNVTGFYGRTGNVGLTTADTISVSAATIGVGAAGTSLLVQGNARITGILTIGTSSITFDGSNNRITVGSATTLDSTGFIGSGANITSLNASNLGSGTIPDARFPAILPAVSGANLTGIAVTANVRTNSLVVSGVSTFSSNPIFIGAATSTGTASQPLQVTGGAYVSGNLGIGTTNPQAPLDVIGNTRISGNLQFNSGYGSVATAYGCRAWVNFDGTAAGTFAGGASTVTRVAGSTTATITTTTAHNLTTGNSVYAASGVVAGAYTVTVLTSTTFTITTVATTALSAVAITFNFANILASGNINSVAKNGTGDYTANFTTAMPDANYVVSLGAKDAGTGNVVLRARSWNTKTSSSVKIFSFYFAGNTNTVVREDTDSMDVSIFR